MCVVCVNVCEWVCSKYVSGVCVWCDCGGGGGCMSEMCVCRVYVCGMCECVSGFVACGVCVV